MAMHFEKKEVKIVAGTVFSENTKRFIEQVSVLGGAMNSNLVLAHVCKPWAGRAWMNTPFEDRYAPTVAHLTEEYLLREAENNMSELSEMISSPPNTSTKVLMGNASDSLISYAESIFASLIVCGTKQQNFKYLPKGLSTALSLMVKSHIPVLAIPDESETNFRSEGMKILLCDGLRQDSLAAINTVREICKTLKNPQVYHSHISGITKSEVENYATSVHDAMDKGILKKEDFNTEKAYDNFENQLNLRMDQRSRYLRTELEELGGEYNRVVRFGRADTLLEEVSKETGADILVFGRHKTVQWKAMAIGKVPFSAMLKINKPVLVSPS